MVSPTILEQVLGVGRVSTIVYRDGVMASDSRAYSGSHRPLGRKTKIRRLPDGTLIGVVTGTPGLGEWLMDEWWAEGHPDVATLPLGCSEKSFTLLAVRPDGTAVYADDSLALAGPIEAPYFAIGSGGSFALGALFHGASAAEAALAAAELDPLSGPPICIATHDKEGVTWL